MAERRLVILKHSGKTPVMAMCDSCQIKVFVPVLSYTLTDFVLRHSPFESGPVVQ